MQGWGQHLILDLQRCVPRLVSCPHNVARFSKALVERIEMTAHGPPIIQHFGLGNKAGLTLVQLISTSNITGHFCDESGDAYLDIFSCRHFHQLDCEYVVREFFRPSSMTARMIVRGPKVSGELS